MGVVSSVRARENDGVPMAVCSFQVVLLVADTDGNHLEEAWEHILTCVSRFEHLHLVGEGAPSDATFFAAPVSDQDKGKLTKTPTIKRKV